MHPPVQARCIATRRFPRMEAWRDTTSWEISMAVAPQCESKPVRATFGSSKTSICRRRPRRIGAVVFIPETVPRAGEACASPAFTRHNQGHDLEPVLFSLWPGPGNLRLYCGDTDLHLA